jgi:solute carrier family 34 (sodium-dependent phosphate cotransporter)
VTDGARERALPFSAGDGHELVIAVPHVTKLVLSYRLLRRLASIIFALGLFVLSLQLMKRGATGITPILDFLSVHSAVNYLGFGWLNAYLLGSGSPVASVALTLYSKGVLSDTQTYFMISGGRLGASFIVLFVGFMYYVRGRREPDGLYIGVVALMTTWLVYAAGIPVGYVLLKSGWLDRVRFGSPGLIKGVNEAYAPAVDFFDGFLPLLGLFVVGVAAVVVSLKMFDAALPSLESTDARVQRIVELLHQKFTMFILGIAITVLTVSVAVSLTILVPLSMKGIVRRQNIIPYVMGAQIGTFVDKLFVTLLLDAPRAFTIIFSEMIAVLSVSLIILVFVFDPFRDFILASASKATSSKRGFAVFLGALFVVPAVLLLV